MDTNGQLYFKHIWQPFFGLILHSNYSSIPYNLVTYSLHTKQDDRKLDTFNNICNGTNNKGFF